MPVIYMLDVKESDRLTASSTIVVKYSYACTLIITDEDYRQHADGI
jgi:hypothetical protein